MIYSSKKRRDGWGFPRAVVAALRDFMRTVGLSEILIISIKVVVWADTSVVAQNQAEIESRSAACLAAGSVKVCF